MDDASFTTNPRPLEELLKHAASGKIQLPDFQRSWVWDEDRIIDLLVSISRAFPIGAVMSLKTGGEVNFHPRPVQGVAEPTREKPEELLLDGQQRITSIYQVAMRGEVVNTTTIKHKSIKRWFYVDIQKAIDPNIDNSEAIFSLPENKLLKASERFPDGLDLSSASKEFDQLMFPVAAMFKWMSWFMPLTGHLARKANGTSIQNECVMPFYERFVKVFESYLVPVISLGKATSKEAVCTVFEKVNTGGKALDAFELVTAMFAADGHKLRDDWYGDGAGQVGYAKRIASLMSIGENAEGVLSKVDNTDFLQVISLFHTRDVRQIAIAEGKQGKELPQVTGKRAALLNLKLDAYKKYRETAFVGFERAAKLIHMFNIFYVRDLPYQTQVIPLAAILADIGNDWENVAVREKLAQWYWCGVFGELYGSAVDTRIGNDFLEVPVWLSGGAAPKTVLEANFHKDRLLTMRMRLSAAYKGVNALLMKAGAKDFRSGQKFEHTSFFDEAVDIHHIFPKKWCKANGKDPKEFDSIVNKTPLTARTNRLIGGSAPSKYLGVLEIGNKDNLPIPSATLDTSLSSHHIDPHDLRSDNYENFIIVRQQALLDLIEAAMKKQSSSNAEDDDAWGEQTA